MLGSAQTIRDPQGNSQRRSETTSPCGRFTSLWRLTGPESCVALVQNANADWLSVFSCHPSFANAEVILHMTSQSASDRKTSADCLRLPKLDLQRGLTASKSPR